MRFLYVAVDALEHVNAITLTNIVTSRAIHIETLSWSNVTWNESAHGIQIQRIPTRNGYDNKHESVSR